MNGNSEGTKPIKTRRAVTAPYCENCGLETEFLFHGWVLPLGSDGEPQKWKGTVFEVSVFEVEPFEGKVCQRCRPPSNLEIQEILNGRNEQTTVEAWNIEHPVGAPVVLTRDSGEQFHTTVKSPAQVLSGHIPVVWVDGISGCYALSRVTGYSPDKPNVQP